MKKAFFSFLLSLLTSHLFSQYTEPWSDPVALTDAESYNSNPEVVVLGNEAYMFYEKKFTPDGPVSIYFREIKSMGDETELLGDPLHSFRNPAIVHFDYPDPGYCLFYESDEAGNYDLYALRFDVSFPLGNTYKLTDSPGDEINGSFNGNYQLAAWENNGNILAAKIFHDPDTVYLGNTVTVDYTGCSDPIYCGYRIVYLKMQEDSASVYYSDWDFSQSQWGTPAVMDSTGNNGYCSCDRDDWFISSKDCIVYEKEGHIFNYFYNEISELELPGFSGDMHEPNSALYDIPVDNLPAPVFITFSSQAEGNKDIYVIWSLWGESAENISEDTLENSNPGFYWGWYAPNPCSMYFLDIWETGQNGFQPLYMSKCALNVCGSTEENDRPEKMAEVFPNPFMHELTIRYFAETMEEVTVEVRNETGQLEGFLKSMPEPGQWNELTWVPSEHTPSGILYLTIKQGHSQLFRKVIYK